MKNTAIDQRGLSRPNVIAITVVVLILAAITGVLVPAYRQSMCGAASMADGTAIKEIHQAMLVYAEQNEKWYPVPGGIDVIRTEGRGDAEDFSLNHSAPLYSFLVASRLVGPKILVSNDCIEVNPGIRVKDDYDFAAYRPIGGVYWDPSFDVRVDDPTTGSNASYAHAALCGDRKSVYWRGISNTKQPILSTRGTRNGATAGPDYERSPTLRLHGPKQTWDGNVVFNDNHTDMLQGFFPTLTYFEVEPGKRERDNIFVAEFDHPRGPMAAADAFLGIFTGSTEVTVDPIWDQLDQ